MKLDLIILILLAAGALFYIGAMFYGMMQIMPWGLLGIAVILIVLGIVGRIVYERMHNEEDDYYQKNVHK